MMIVRSLVVTAAASLFLVAQAGGQPERRDYAGELREMLKAGLSEAEQQRCVDARAELSAVDAEVKRIDREVLAEFASSTWAQGDHGVPTYVDISLLGDLTGRFARPVDWAIAHEAMRRYEAAGLIARLHSVAAAPRLPNWDDVASGTVYDTMYTLGHFRAASTVLRQSAQLHALQGESDCAIDDLRAVFRLGAMLSGEATSVIDALVGISTTALGVHTTRDLMQQGAFDALSLERLGAVLDESMRIPDRAAALDVNELEQLVSLMTVIDGSSQWFRQAWIRQAEEATEAYRQEYLGLLELPHAQRIAAAREPSEFMKPHVKFMSPINHLVESPFDMSKFFRNIDQLESESRGVRLAVAAEAYRATIGELPISLDALAPRFIAAIPTDVYAPDGRFRYQVQPAHGGELGGFLIYSVGLDGIDDGGAMPDGEKTSPYDATSGRCTNCDFVIFPMK